MKKIFTFLCFLPILFFSQNKYRLEVIIKGAKNNQGTVYVAVYTKENFLRKVFLGNKSPIKNNVAIVNFDNVIPSGEYAIAAFHDENNNNLLDFNFLQIPKEDYVFSNKAKSTFFAPKFKDAKIKISNDTKIVLMLN